MHTGKTHHIARDAVGKREALALLQVLIEFVKYDFGQIHPHDCDRHQLDVFARHEAAVPVDTEVRMDRRGA